MKNPFSRWFGRAPAPPAPVVSQTRAATTPRSADTPENAHLWRPLGGQRTWNINPVDHRKMVRVSINAFQKFGMARGAVRMITGFTVGSQPVNPVVEMPQVEPPPKPEQPDPVAQAVMDPDEQFTPNEPAPNPAKEKAEKDRELVQALLDSFWCDPINDMPKKLSEISNGLSVTGSLCVTLNKDVNPETGEGSMMTHLAYVDPATIQDVIVDPGNALSPIAVTRDAGTFGMNRKPVLHPIVRKDQKVHGFLRQPGSEEPWPVGTILELPSKTHFSGKEEVIVGLPCKYLGINRIPGQSVGLSDLYAAADVMQLHDESLFAAGERGANLAAFAWWVKFPAGTPQAKLDKDLENLRDDIESGAGRLVGTTEDVELSAVSPALQAAEWATHEMMLRTNVLISLGPLPLHWFADGSTTNLATAGEQGSPVMNFLLDRQTQVAEFWLDIIDYALRVFPESRAMLEADAKAFKIRLPLPVLAGKDQSREVDILTKEQQTVNAYETNGVLTVEAKQRLSRESLNRYGFSVTEEDMQDPDEVREKKTMPFGGLPLPGAGGGDDDEDEDGVGQSKNFQEKGEKQVEAA